MKVIVTGSLGHISKPLATTLAKQGHEVIVISSNLSKQKEIEAIGATAAIGKLEDVDFLSSTFTGADMVYAMIPPDFNAPDIIERYKIIGKNYAAAIERSGVKKIIQLSSWGAHLPTGTGIIVGSYHVEQILNQLKEVSITYLRPTSFYYNLYHYIPMIKNAGIIGTNFGGDDRLNLVAPEDIAAAAVEEIKHFSTGIKVRYVDSDEHTCNEAAAILGAAIGKPNLQWVRFTDKETKAAMERNGVSPHVAGLLVQINAAIRTGIMREDYDQHKPVMGKVKLQDFAKEFAAKYNES